MRERRGGLNGIQPGNWFWIILYINILLCVRIVYHIGAKSYYILHMHIHISIYMYIYIYTMTKSPLFFLMLFLASLARYSWYREYVMPIVFLIFLFLVKRINKYTYYLIAIAKKHKCCWNIEVF